MHEDLESFAPGSLCSIYISEQETANGHLDNRIGVATTVIRTVSR